ncbi:MAG: hypothetical protein R3362_01680, partial [Rhodothermales bacterium]|nr:hypothetical protein [Rhodothermales bacterium]
MKPARLAFLLALLPALALFGCRSSEEVVPVEVLGIDVEPAEPPPSEQRAEAQAAVTVEDEPLSLDERVPDWAAD